MTTYSQLQALEERIRYWEGVRLIARSGDYPTIRTLAVTLHTSRGKGPKSEDKIRKIMLDKIDRRLRTIGIEAFKQARSLGVEPQGAPEDWGWVYRRAQDGTWGYGWGAPTTDRIWELLGVKLGLEVTLTGGQNKATQSTTGGGEGNGWNRP